MLAEYLLEKSLDAALEYTKKFLGEVHSKVRSRPKDLQEHLSYYFTELSNWCSTISFRDLKRSKLTKDIYIEQDIFIYPRRIRISPDENISSISLQEIFASRDEHFILLGQPGAGKTTSMKYLCEKVLRDPDFYPNQFYMPIAIRLRDLNEGTGHRGRLPEGVASLDSIIIKHIFRLFNLDIQFAEELLRKEESANRLHIIERIVVRFLEELRVLLIIDGFDEVASTRSKNIVISEIRKLAHQLQKSTMVVTSRTGEFPYSVENCKEYELCPLDDQRIFQFCNKWLGDQDQARTLVTAIQTSPFADATIKPLTLAHLCAIYERIGKIPDKPKTVYRKIISLLLEEWDEQRSVNRTSKYASFESDRKSDFLSNLAYELTTRYGGTVFSKDQLRKAYQAIHLNFDLPKSEAQEVVDELETHTGLFIQSGFETFEFVHKSLQEFLTAEYIVKLPRIPNETKIITALPNELAIAVTVSSNASTYLIELVLNTFYNFHLDANFYEVFINRLLQEKPDFPTTDEIVLVLLSLYSLYLRGEYNSGLAGTRTDIDEILLRDFENLIRTVMRRNPGNALRLHYRLQKSSQNGDDIFVLRKIDSTTSERLPEYLYVRSTFIP